MSVKERIFHSFMFELVALLLLTIAVVLFTDKNALEMSGLALAISLIAMAWNYIYNLGFDYLYGYDRNSRSAMMRIIHGIAFELGLLVVTIPLLMWVLALDFLTVLLLDIGFVVFFCLYAIVFNWLYDKARAHWTLSASKKSLAAINASI